MRTVLADAEDEERLDFAEAANAVVTAFAPLRYASCTREGRGARE
jgi:hypothetical protein